jgi:hypothetical protein
VKQETGASLATAIAGKKSEGKLMKIQIQECVILPAAAYIRCGIISFLLCLTTFFTSILIL